MRFAGIFCLTLSMLLLANCGGNDPSPVKDNKDRRPMLENLVDNLVIPAYEIFQEKLDLMQTAVTAFNASPSEENLLALRTAWASAYVEWQNVELFEFGPGEKYAIRSYFNIYPTDVAGINSYIADPNLSLESFSSYPKQGFPALDYLINGIDETDTEIVARYSTDIDAAKRRAFLVRLTTRMVSLLDKVVTEWATYRETFVSKTGLDIGSSTGLVVNAYVLEYERFIRSGKIGIPSGAMVAGGGSPQPTKVEAYYMGDLSKTLAQTANAAAKRFFIGQGRTNNTAGPSLRTYLEGLDARDSATGDLLSTIIETQFDLIQQKIDALPVNFSESVETNNAQMLDTFTAMQRLVRLLKVDMTSAMSVTITYTDNDGD